MNIASFEQHRLLKKELKHTVELTAELTVDSASCSTDTTLKYYVTRKRGGVYGISVYRYQFGIAVDKQSVANLTYSVSEINRIANILAKHTVLPSTLIEVLDELEVATDDFKPGDDLLANDLFAPETLQSAQIS